MQYDPAISYNQAPLMVTDYNLFYEKKIKPQQMYLQ